MGLPLWENRAAAEGASGVGAGRAHIGDLSCATLSKQSYGVQSTNGAICRSRLLSVTTTLRQQGP